MRYGHDENRTLYRSREGMIFGVCRGLAEHYSFSVSWMRIIVLAASTATGFWPTVGLYIVAALIMKLEPVLPLENEEDKEFYHSYADSRSMALHRLKRTYDNLDRRIQRLENTVTTREYDWDERLQH
ncbi:MAG: PspC domain-containing protein [Candidatus Hydrogenedentota bacterium]